MRTRRDQTLLLLGFTAVFVGYLTVWLVGPAAGLSFLGVEMGEWLKFLGVGGRRDLFYLPPITLSLMLIAWTVTWPGGWRAWAARGLAVLIGLLAFPAFEDIFGPVREQYLLRLGMIIGVIAAALLAGWWQRSGRLSWLPWVMLILLGLAGAFWPSWMFFQVRPAISQHIGLPVSMGLGGWLNGIGHLLVAIVAVFQLPGIGVSLPAKKVT